MISLNISAIDEYLYHLYEVLIAWSPRVVSAFLVLIAGLYVIRLINRFVKNVMVKRALDPTLSKFLADILLWALRLLLFVTFISRLGIETSSFVAILGAAGLAVGLSLQGSLSNFAGGMLIILFKPFKVGDAIEAQNVSGTVAEIQIFVTKLITANNQAIFIPNGILSNGTIINYSMEPIRRADLTLALAYDIDVNRAKSIVMGILENHPSILKSPAPQVVIKGMDASSVQLAVRPWASNEDFWDMTADVLEKSKTAFEKAGIAMQPYVREQSV